MQSIDTLEAYWQDIKNIPTLTEEQEKSLAERIQQGDERAIERLVTGNLRYVVSVARQYVDKGLSMDDLISEGNMAMMIAARKWKPQEGQRFVNYAIHDIRKAMEQAIPSMGPMITLPKKDKKAGSDLHRMSTDAPLHPGQTNTLGDMLKAGKPMTDDEAEDNEIGYALTVAMRYLNEREKKVLMHFYAFGTEEHLTMAEIGEKLGLKRERVRQVRKTAERKMRRILKQFN